MFDTLYQEFIYKRTYARWIDSENRREDWNETVDRYKDFFMERVPKDHIPEFIDVIQSVKSLDVMPSMRALWVSGRALQRENISSYNCAYITINNIRAFAEMLYILMNGTGVGFSVERQYINQLPTIPNKFKNSNNIIVFADSKRGWAEGYYKVLMNLYKGEIPKYDLSRIRPAGARLKVFGGLACLTGDTVVYKDRKKSRSYNEITLQDLYNMKHSLGFWKHKPNHFKDVKLRSLNEETGKFYRNKLIDIIDNGIASVFKITTKHGYTIKATHNHRFMNEIGKYQFLSEFKVGDNIAVNGSKEKLTGVCIDCGCKISRRALRCVSCFNKYQLKQDALPVTCRQRKEVVLFKEKHKNSKCEICNCIQDKKRFEIHHKDGNPANNDHDNLLWLCPHCHQTLHAKQRTFSDSYSHRYLSFDKIISIEELGSERVYDLVMEAPDHNFIANGFISHNSGPGPLEALIKFTIDMIVNNKGKKLSSINCHDICCTIAQVVVVGSVRRSACISLSNLSDDRMAKAKSGFFWQNDPQRLMSNNSVAYTEKPDSRKFLSEWIKLIESKTGERGLFNRVGSKLLASKSGRRDSSYEFGINPCQPEWATLYTKDGIKQFKDVKVGDEIWSKDGWVRIVNKQSSGIKSVYRYRTNASVFYGTDTHRIISSGEKIMVKDASSIDSLCCKSDSTEFLPDVVMDGIVMGDGSNHKASNNLIYLCIGKDDYDYFDSEISNLIIKHRPGIKKYAYEIETDIKAIELPKTFDRYVPLRYKYNKSQVIKSFLRGLYTANGSIIESANRVTLKSASKQLVEDVQIMLSAVGIRSYITKNKSKYVKFNNGIYKCKRSYDINITTDTDIFYNTIGFIQKYKMKKLKECLVNKKKRTGKVTYDINSIEYISTEEVYNITVDGKSHTYWTGGCDVSNCAEVILRPMEFCNLTEVVIRKDDNLKTLKSKIRNATILGCLQSTLTDFKFINRTWKQNCEEERLLGVSLTGVMDNPVLNNINKEMKVWLHEMKEEAISTAEDWSRYLNINMPTAITAIKPAGTTSQLTNTSSGIHARYAPYYLRRVRVSSLDPLAKFLLSKGVPVKPEVDSTMENTSNYVFEFPIKSPDTSRMRDELTTIQQLELYKVYMLYYVEHNISMTVYVKDHEWPEVASWVYKNWDSICGLSFLPYDTGVYKLAPYTELTEEEYIELDASFPKDIDFKDLNKFETEDKTEGAQVLACTGGACEI